MFYCIESHIKITNIFVKHRIHKRGIGNIPSLGTEILLANSIDIKLKKKENRTSTKNYSLKFLLHVSDSNLNSIFNTYKNKADADTIPEMAPSTERKDGSPTKKYFYDDDSNYVIEPEKKRVRVLAGQLQTASRNREGEQNETGNWCVVQRTTPEKIQNPESLIFMTRVQCIGDL